MTIAILIEQTVTAAEQRKLAAAGRPGRPYRSTSASIL